MFRPRPDAPAATIAVEVERRTVLVTPGASAAAAVLLAGLPSLRDTPVRGSERAPYCMMGVCFECLVEIDGAQNRQSCLVTVEHGMVIRSQHGMRALAENDAMTEGARDAG